MQKLVLLKSLYNSSRLKQETIWAKTILQRKENRTQFQKITKLILNTLPVYAIFSKLAQ